MGSVLIKSRWIAVFRIPGMTADLWTVWKNIMAGETFSETQLESVKLYTNVTQKAKKENFQKL